MKTYSSPLSSYRAAGREHYQINLVSFQVRDRGTNALVWKHFSSRDYNETINVINQSSGAPEARDYVGGGALVAMDPLIRSEGTGVRNFSLVLSATSTDVLDMLQGYDARDAVFEWHIGEADGETGLLVDTPVCEFEGFVDAADRSDAALGITSGEPSEATFTVSVTSHISTLQRANPDMRSHEVGQERSGDDIFAYTGAANQWAVLWGKRGHRHKDRDGGDGRDRPTEPRDPWGHGR